MSRKRIGRIFKPVFVGAAIVALTAVATAATVTLPKPAKERVHQSVRDCGCYSKCRTGASSFNGYVPCGNNNSCNSCYAAVARSSVAARSTRNRPRCHVYPRKFGLFPLDGRFELKGCAAIGTLLTQHHRRRVPRVGVPGGTYAGCAGSSKVGYQSVVGSRCDRDTGRPVSVGLHDAGARRARHLDAGRSK